MPNNPHKRPCAYPGCRAWARRDAEAPYCASHLHLAPELGPEHPDIEAPSQSSPRPWALDPRPEYPRPGAPPGNQNRLVHGFYRRTLPEEEDNHLDEGAEANDLDAEILIARLALRRTLAMLYTGATLGEGRRPLEPEEIPRLIGLTFQGVRTIARLLAVKHTLGAGDSLFTTTMNEVLDELSAEWGIDL